MSSRAMLPDCWGHRGASASFPENTLASFEAAVRDGSEGIESDVHVSVDGVVLMFHDPSLDRTTDSKGKINQRNWYGPEGMEHVRTIKEPKQSIPTFAETVALLMQPENLHVKFNVDVKVQNDPDRLFSLMHAIIAAHDDWEALLAPRLLLGLWHPRFLPYAKQRLPYCKRSHIGHNPQLAREWFWDDCEVFSMSFSSMCSSDGQKFMEECKGAGKKMMVWTVNEPAHMMEAVRWGVDVILTDFTRVWLDMRAELQADYSKQVAQYDRFFLWTSWRLYSPVVFAQQILLKKYLEGVAGPFNQSLPMMVE